MPARAVAGPASSSGGRVPSCFHFREREACRRVPAFRATVSSHSCFPGEGTVAFPRYRCKCGLPLFPLCLRGWVALPLILYVRTYTRDSCWWERLCNSPPRWAVHCTGSDGREALSDCLESVRPACLEISYLSPSPDTPDSGLGSITD
jgi:hypothetical protein